MLALARRLPADRHRARRTAACPRSPSSTPVGAASRPASSKRGVAALGDGPRRGHRARRSGRAATRSATRSSEPVRALGLIVATGSLDLWRAAERRCARRRRARRAARHLHGVQPGAVLLAPPRRRAARRPRGRRCCRLTRCASATSASRGEVGPGVTVVAATKYVAARRDGRRSPRPASRSSARTARRISRRSTPSYGDAFRWHFIGHLQSQGEGRQPDLRARATRSTRDSAARAARGSRRSSR